MTELNLIKADSRLSQAPLTTIRTQFDRLFGPGEWQGWEPETFSIELSMVMDDLLLDKIQVLQILERSLDLFFDDPAFMLYATEVMNNNVADFDSVPAPTSLELAFAITQATKIAEAAGHEVTFNGPIVTAVSWMLRQEGYSKPIEPFSFVPPEVLERGQTPGDTEAKSKAIDAYIKYMEAQ